MRLNWGKRLLMRLSNLCYNEFEGMFKLNEKKYRNAILYFANKVGKGSVRGRKKMYKLFYYLDFDFFEKYEKPITGDVYHKLPMGPAPSYLDAITEDLVKEDFLNVTKRKTGSGYRDTVVYKPLKESDLSVFSPKELGMLKRVVKKYGNKTGTELETLTHKEAPYLAVEEGEEIPLELAHYRGTSFG